MGKSLQEIYALPSSEMATWEEYFNIYPFSQDRQDARFAMLCQTVANVSGNLKKSVGIEMFLPDFLDRASPTSRQQVDADREFGERLMAMQAQMRN